MIMSKDSQSQKKQAQKKTKKASNFPKTQSENQSSNSDAAELVERIEKMPPDKKEAVISKFFSGPIPPAAELNAYEKVIPGAAERIIKMAEDESVHRRNQEEKMLSSSCGDSRLGLWLGFFIGLSALTLSGLIAIYASPGAGSFLAFASISSLVGVFVYGSKKKREEDRSSQE